MSRFFRSAASDSDSESSGSDNERVGEVPVAARPAPKGHSFMMSDSEEETKRVVRATKDKRYDELKDLIKLMKNAKKIKDMSRVQTIFEDLSKSYEKAKSIVNKEGGVIPRFFVRCIVELEEFVTENWEDREGRKNMSKNNSKGLTTLRQRLKKYMRDFEAEAMEYRNNPDPEGYSTDEASAGEEGGAMSDDDDDDSESEDEDVVNFLKKKEGGGISRPAKAADDDSDVEDDDEWASNDDSSSDESVPELDELETKDMEKLRQYFLKKAPSDKDAEKEAKREEKRKRLEDRRKRRQGAEENEGEWEQVERGTKHSEQPKLFEADAEITVEAVVSKLGEILAARGKKGTDRKEQVTVLQDLHAIAETNNLGPAMSIKILFSLCASLFDYNPKIADCMEYASWQRAVDVIHQIIGVLSDTPDLIASEQIGEDQEDLSKHSGTYSVRGCVLSMLERLDDEFTRILQHEDCHSTDYVDKLKGEKNLTDLTEELRLYLVKQECSEDEICRVYMRQIEHLYYKFDLHSLDGESVTPVVTEDGQEPSVNLMDRMCKYIYNNDHTRRLRARAMLCQIYHHALHERWHEARDLALMSHLQPMIDHSDISTQILYNRAICQLGLCAFRHGYIREAHNALSDIQNGGKSRELLAQGLSMRNQQERTVEQEKLEKQRQVPYHMHINLELLECVYLIAAMLLEIPQMASKEFEVRRRLISRSFHYQLKLSERLSLRGPPENTREHVVAAARALLNGDWRACRDYIANDKMNAKVWNLFHRSDVVRSMLIRRIQEESLRTYLLTYSAVYDSISYNILSEMFDMDTASVQALVSKMIINEELAATLDEPAECVAMHRVEPSRLQTLSLQLTEKLKALAENNESIVDPRAGQSFSYRPGGNWFQQRQQQNPDNRGQRNQDNRGQRNQDNRGQRNQGDRRQNYNQNRGGGGGEHKRWY